MTSMTLRHVREKQGPITITDEMLVVLAAPDGRGEAYAFTVAELREHLMSKPAGAD